MADDFDMETVRGSLQRLMDAKGVKRKPLAQQAGLGETAIRDIFDPKRQDVKASTLVKLAEFFDTSIDALTRPDVPLVGKIGAGGQVIFEDDGERGGVPRPPSAAGQLVALEVVGDSMMPKYEGGDVVYVRRDHDGVLPEYVGEYCAVRTADGGTWLKMLAAGSKPGTFTLRSLNAADMVDQDVEWASPVLWVMPRRSRHSAF